MRVLTFEPQFHEAVRQGLKTSTIRDSARCSVGTELSLRQWLGRPYHTNQALLRPNLPCTAVTAVKMEVGLTASDVFKLYIDARKLSDPEPIWMLIAAGQYIDPVAEAIAKREGFPDFEAMKAWFLKAKKIRPGRPYIGSMIEWDPEA